MGASVLSRVTPSALFLCVCLSSWEQSEGQFERPCLLQPPRCGCQGEGVPTSPAHQAVAQRRPEPGGQSEQGAQELELRGPQSRTAGLPGQGRSVSAELGRWVRSATTVAQPHHIKLTSHEVGILKCLSLPALACPLSRTLHLPERSPLSRLTRPWPLPRPSSREVSWTVAQAAAWLLCGCPA